MADRLLTSQLVVQVETTEPSKLKVSQFLVQVEYAEPEYGTFNGNLLLALTPAAIYSAHYVHTGGLTLSLGPASTFYYQPPGEHWYEGTLSLTLTPSSTLILTHAHTGALTLSLVPSCLSVGPIAFVGNLTITFVVAGSYRMPIVGFDNYTGYGLVNLTFLEETPPYYVVDGHIDLLLTPISVTTYYKEFTLIGLGALAISGSGVYEVMYPPIFEIEGSGGIKVSGVGTKVLEEPPSLAVEGTGGVAVSGKGIATFTGVGDIPTYELTGSGGVNLAGRGTTTTPGTKPSTYAVTGFGGVDIGGIGQKTFTSPGTVELPRYSAVGLGGIRLSGGDTSAVSEPPAAYEVIAAGGLVVDGAGLVARYYPPPLFAVEGTGGILVGGGTVPAVNYITWVFSADTFEPALYGNFGFNSYAQFGDRYLGAKDDGIYALEGEDDGGVPISSGVVLGPFHLGSMREKTIRAIYPGGNCANALVRLEGTNGSATFHVVNGKVECGACVIGSKLTLSIADFDDLDTLELVPFRRAHK